MSSYKSKSGLYVKAGHVASKRSLVRIKTASFGRIETSIVQIQNARTIEAVCKESVTDVTQFKYPSSLISIFLPFNVHFKSRSRKFNDTEVNIEARRLERTSK